MEVRSVAVSQLWGVYVCVLLAHRLSITGRSTLKAQLAVIESLGEEKITESVAESRPLYASSAPHTFNADTRSKNIQQEKNAYRHDSTFKRNGNN